MAAQKGSALVIARGDAASPEVFTTLAGLQTKSMNINRETVDITNSDSSNKWRELLADAGIRSISATGSGVFTDAAVDASLENDIIAGTANGNFQITVPDFGTFEGAFQVSAIQYSGEHNAEVQYEFTIESAGAVTFTAA